MLRLGSGQPALVLRQSNTCHQKTFASLVLMAHETVAKEGCAVGVPVPKALGNKQGLELSQGDTTCESCQVGSVERLITPYFRGRASAACQFSGPSRRCGKPS